MALLILDPEENIFKRERLRFPLLTTHNKCGKEVRLNE